MDRIGSRSVRMTSDEIMQRGFSSKVRGISETEVRSFLRRIGEEIDRMGKREDELLEKITELQDALEAKPKASKAELLENLGEQTTRVLSSAEEAAEQMITDAKAESEAMISNAKKESDQMLSDARTQAEKAVADAHDLVRSMKESSHRDVSVIVSQARAKGREIFQESVVVREQILKDLLRRRDLLMEQIDQLRIGREELLDSYKVVKGSFQKATDALHSVEEKASSELMNNPIDVDALLKAPVELPSVLDANQAIPASMYDQQQDESPADESKKVEVEVDSKESNSSIDANESKDSKIEVSERDNVEIAESKTDEAISITGKRKTLKNYVKEALGAGEDEVIDLVSASTETETEAEVPSESSSAIGNVTKVPKKKDVGALFQSLKVQNEEKTDAEAIEKSEVATQVDVMEDEKAEAKSSKKASKKKTQSKKDPVATRDEVLSGVTTTILRKAKRQLQDEQNELLEALRTIKPKKRVAAENILPDEQTQIKTWEEAIRSELETVFNAGSSTISSENFTYEDEALKSAVNWIISPLRETLTMAIDEGEQSDATSRVGARYREWRNSDLKNALYDALCSAYNNGVVSAAKSDSTLNWVVEKAGQCPDCDDNALEPTTLGEAFPTGQVVPPAHSGCRCVIAVA